MNKIHSRVAVHRNSAGGVTAVSLLEDAVKEFGALNVAAAAVPDGAEFYMVPHTEYSKWYADFGDLRAAWEYEDSRPTDGVGHNLNTPSGVKNAG